MAMNPDKKVNFEDEWPKVVAGFNQILNAIETGKGITREEWMFHYNSVFSLAIAQHEEKMYVELARIFEKFVRGQSKKIFEKTGGELMLKEYLKLFNDFTKTSLSVHRICRYLQRYWIPGNLGKSPSGIEVREIQPLALVMWREHCFDPIKDKLIPSLLDLLDQDRNGNKQDKSLIRNMVQSYIEFDKVGPNEGQQFYEKEFESRYVERIKQFYAAESTQFLQANGVSLYLQKAEERINEEKANAEYLGTYLQTSEPKIKKAIDEVLIEKHMEQIQADFLRMLKEDKNDDMKRLYFLLSRVVDGLPNSANTFQSYLVETGSKIVVEQQKKNLKDALGNAVVFVKALITFYEKYYGLVGVCFSNHALFKTALDKAFRDIMNQDSGKFNIPRLLNFYIDSIIKGKEKDKSTEDEIDEVLQRLVNLFSYLQDKDEFFEYFRKALCKRLLTKGKQYNENAEKSFLSKLKAQSGDAAIRKLQGMFTDVQDESINEMRQKFEDHNKGSKVGGVDVEVQVLNESHWPISGTQKFPLLLGQQLLLCQTKFQQFYDKTTEKRRLQWLYNYGTVTLAARFTNSKLPIQLVLTPLQASILMCFNESPKLTFDELLGLLWPTQPSSGRTMLTSSQNPGQMHDMSLEEILKFAIQPLIYFKYKVIAKEKDEDPKKENVNKTDVFMLREKIPAKKLPRKIAFPPGSAKQQKQEFDADHELVMKQREFEIEAAMVRVMKARNRLDWNQLQIEVINILKNRFTPDSKMLKKRLESLIDRKFMERDENDPKIIIYIS
eukprot:TRINITY_DN1295_c0_g1_i1.p1 TRINITY_DN1295_c0_g1~~TRINITY_DN1295_c0_g1_i1.p1  ORF type:complete len:780 (-),score=255.74 TRINITY_DN1295_c0_g1_i1:133-2472(-)